MEIDWTQLAAIPDFTPVSVLGTPGGQGIAVRGTWHGRDVVLKALFPAAFDERAWQHARAATTITHPNVVHIDFAGEVEIEGELIHYVVMPFVEGRTLEQAMAGGQRWSVTEALGIAAQIADGLGALHEVGRIHRDIKPQNILYAAGGAVQIIDLDLVHYDGFDTLTGRWAYTPGYAPREVVIGNRFSERSDLFSLGIVLHQLLAGAHPFAAAGSAAQQARIQASETPDPLPLAVPSAVRDLVGRMLDHRAANRPIGAGDVARELRGVPPTGQRSLNDVGLGIRLTSRSRTAVAAYLASDTTDLLVADAKLLPANFPGGWDMHEGPLLIDPHTDWLAAGLGKRGFLTLAERSWRPNPFVPALTSGSNDDELVESILRWQRGLGATGLIAPYVRIERWSGGSSQDLDRNRSLSSTAVRIARREWPDLPLYAAVAIGNGTFKDDDRRDAVLEMLTCLRADGAYVVIENKASDAANYFEQLADFGQTLRRQGLEALLAHSGPEAVAIAGSGSWDGLITGHQQANRAAQFQPQRGGNQGTRPARLLAHRYLYEVQDRMLRKLADVAVGVLRCDCTACQTMFGSGTFRYDHAHQGPHYYGSLHRWFREIRAEADGARKGWLQQRFKDALTAAPAIDRQPPPATRLSTSHLRQWAAQFLR
jgi:serine/threonine protein kinase